MESAHVLEAPDDSGSANSFPLSTPARGLLAVLSIAAGTIHLAMVTPHAAEWMPEGIAFALVGWFALAFAVAICVKPSRKWLEIGIAANIVFIAAWAVTRYVGMPFGPGSGSTEAASLVDLTCVGLEAAIVLASVVFLKNPRLGEKFDSGALVMASVVPLAVIALTTTVLAVPSGHSHGAGAESANGAEGVEAAQGADHHGATTAPAAAGEDHSNMPGMDHSASGGHGAVPAGMATEDPNAPAPAPAPSLKYDPAKPLNFGGVEGVSPEEQARAENLVAITLIRLPQFADYKYAESVGFSSIGDGLTGTEHFINQAYMDDGEFMNPDKPESLVYDTKRDGTKTLAAVMYMVNRGTPLSEVPNIGGKLTQWHTHQNLCYQANGKLGGLTNAEGKCAPGLFLPEPTPMIHVWIRKHPCGPFAALEGIGGGTIAEGETKLCDTTHGGH
jgi:hypothetical protein